jgi:2-polyprenyl-6-methoxyphenol hydroxylase-like FAD-dependent oxidoreductase
MVLGLLLARAGARVAVLEKHADFLRDFRGDTLHPSTLEVIGELGALHRLLERPHHRIETIAGHIGDSRVNIADFSRLSTRCKFIAIMPQWDFLDFIAEEGARYPGFELRMEAEALDVLRDGDRVTGVRAATPDGPLEIHADLTVGADGRSSTIRERLGLPIRELGAPMDVLWIRIPRDLDDPDETFGRVAPGRVMVLINRVEYWQCGFVIEKGGFERLRERGLEPFRAEVARLAPFVADRIEAIESWEQVKLLTVRVDRLERWYAPGALCIGDAAHAMSPIGGVGINLAIQDAVAAANRLAAPLVAGRLETADLRAVQRRRELPTRLTQRAQVIIQKRILGRVLARNEPLSVPWPIALAQRWPALQRIPGRLLGVGLRPEHVEDPPAIQRSSI